MRNPWKAKSLGLDVGSRAIKVLQLQRRGRRVELAGCYVRDLSDQNPGYPENSDAAEALKALVEVRELGSYRAHASLSDRDLMSFDFPLPQMPAKDLELAVANELEKRLHFPIEEANVDFVASPEPSGGGKGLRIKAYCAHRESVASRCRLLTEAQLVPASVESDMLALCAALEFNGYFEPAGNCVLINLGDSKTSVAHVMGASLAGVNIVELGVARLNQSLRERGGLGFAQAEAKILGEPCEPELQQVIDQHWSQMTRELEPLLESIKEQSASKPIDHIYLAGGGSQHPPLAQIIQDGFGIATEAIDPFRKVDIFSLSGEQSTYAAAAAPFMAVALGLALRGL